MLKILSEILKGGLCVKFDQKNLKNPACLLVNEFDIQSKETFRKFHDDLESIMSNLPKLPNDAFIL
jgi:hypothetical protein